MDLLGSKNMLCGLLGYAGLQLRSKRQLAAKDMMADPKSAIRKINGLEAMISLLEEIVKESPVLVECSYAGFVFTLGHQSP